MRNVTTAFRRTLTNINRKWLPYVDITLLDGTVLPQFTDATLWTSGLSFEDVVSEDEKFTALGAVIMGAATVVIDNTGEKWNDYDFNDADVTIQLGLEVNGAPEVLRIGQYTVADAKYNGATVTLTLQDYMHQFDRPYDTALVYPATAGNILRDACTNCGVLYDNSLLEFTNNDYTVAAKPDGENTTYRDVVAWVAQLAGCFAKFNATGKLEFKWFGDDILTAAQQGYDGGEFDPANPYATGDNANGGSFNPWNIGAELDGGALTDNGNCHYIGSLFSETIALDNTVITGVSVSAEREGDNGRETVTATSGTTGYVIGIEGNKLISADDVQTFATYLGTRVIGLTFRKSRVTHLSDPSIEAGDVALLFDHKSREYPILITRTRFTTGGRQETVCGSETPARNRAKQFSQETKNYVDLRRQLKKAQTAWNLAEASLRQQLQTASGLYMTEVEEPVGSGAYKTYYHDKAELEDSNIVMLFTDYGFTLTSDYQNGQNATWYGIGADGTGILDVLNTHGVNADWVNTGIIQDATGKNKWNLDTGEFTLTGGAKIGTGTDTIGKLVTSCTVQYALTTTSSAPADSSNTWGATASWEKGKYLWSRTKTVTQDGTTTYTTPELIVDQYGNGAGVTAVETEWIQTTTNTAPAANNGSWSTTQPSFVYGRYIWTRTKITYADGTTEKTTAVLANSLNKSPEDTWKELTDNGQIDGIYRVYNSDTQKYELHVSAACIGAEVLRSKDANENFRLDLSTGQMTMKKGSINLGYNSSTSSYNFTVNDSGQVAIKSGSITLGDMSDTSDATKYYFNATTNGRLSWNEQYSSMDTNGRLQIKRGDITSIRDNWISGHNLYSRLDGGEFKIGTIERTSGTEKLTGHIWINTFDTTNNIAKWFIVNGTRNLRVSANQDVLLASDSGKIGFYVGSDTTGAENYHSRWKASVGSDGLHDLVKGLSTNSGDYLYLPTDSSFSSWYRVRVIDGIIVPGSYTG